MVGYLFLFVGSAILFVLATSLIFPKLFLKPRCMVSESKDRGIERVKGKNFTGIVYAPEPSLMGKVDRYIMEEKNGKKILRVKFAQKIRYVDYDVVAFSVDGQTLDVLRVKEIIGAGGSAATELPEETACVSISINETDSGTEKRPLKLSLKKSGIFFYCFFSFLAIVAESFLVKFCIAQAFGGIFNESFISGNTFGITALIVCPLAIICVVSFYLAVKRRIK